MYQTVNPVELLIEKSAEYVIKNDRMRYSKYFIVAEKFIKENDIIIGGVTGLNILTGESLSKDSFYYELFTTSAFKKAKRLTDLMYDIDKNIVISLDTIIMNREYRLNIDTRTLFSIYSLDHPKHDLQSAIKTELIKGYFTDYKLRIVGPRLFLTDTYRKLYSPYPFDVDNYLKYPILYEREKKMFSMLNFDDSKSGGFDDPTDDPTDDTIEGGIEIFNKISYEHKLLLGTINSKGSEDHVGGYDYDDYPDYDLSESNDDSEYILGGAKSVPDDWKQVFEEFIIKNMISNSDYVIIGDMAMNISIKSSKRLQIISPEDIDKIIEKIKSLLSSEVKYNAIDVTYNKHDPNIPFDFRLKKYVVHITNDLGDKISIMDVFNSSQYELIPYEQHGDVKIGSPWVLIRFKFIDLWMMDLIERLNQDVGNFSSRRINDIKKQIIEMRAVIEDYMETDQKKLFKTSPYIGVYTNEFIAKKKLLKTGFQLPKYYPSG